MAKKQAEKKEKKEKVAKKQKGIWEQYEVKGDTLTRKSRWSPKAGPGFFMAKHKDRETCGSTGYTEFAKADAKADKAPAKE